MINNETTVHTWSSRSVFYLAAIGAAVGLGNIWKFPYTTGVSGGGAFVLVYLLAIFLVAVPIVMAELMIGRRGRKSPPTNFETLAAHAATSKHWRLVGWLNVLAVFLILSFYSVIAGWALAYITKVASGMFRNIGNGVVEAEFNGLLASPLSMTLWHALFMIVTVVIVSQGLDKGIERAVKWLMPALFLMLAVLIGYAAIQGDLPRATGFLFAVDFSKIDANVILMAIGQAFFSVSVAMGLMITYGAYMRPQEYITKSAVVIAGADTLVAIMAGFAIFPLVFANGLDPAGGPGLLFLTLPLAFGKMPAGALFGTIFFVLLVFSALTSSIAILESVISRFVENNPARRKPATIVAGFSAWLIGLLTVFSFNLWRNIKPLSMFELFKDKTLFDLLDYLTSNIMLPLGGILIAIFSGWVMSREDPGEEPGLMDGKIYFAWRFLIRYVAPVAVAAVLIANAA
jgi:NSS family neurotransmitter:Na+ symporter